MRMLLKPGWVHAGLGGMVFNCGGYHVFFTYLRPFLEKDLALKVNDLAFVLSGFGIVNCAGTFVAGILLGSRFRKTIIMIHIMIACVAHALLTGSRQTMENMVFVMIRGFIFGIIPVA